jgi:hypothetical protein
MRRSPVPPHRWHVHAGFNGQITTSPGARLAFSARRSWLICESSPESQWVRYCRSIVGVPLLLKRSVCRDGVRATYASSQRCGSMAGFTAGGSSLDRQKSRANSRPQNTGRDPATGPELRTPGAVAQTRMVSVAKILLDPPKSTRPGWQLPQTREAAPRLSALIVIGQSGGCAPDTHG